MKEFEGIYWMAKSYSNRHGVKIEFTSVATNGTFRVPESRVGSTLQRLESGESPDDIAKSFPIEWN